jgi:hypothetical protein
MRNGKGLGIAVVTMLAAMSLAAGNAKAGTTDIFDNLSNPAFHGEGVDITGFGNPPFGSDPEAASFFTGNYGGSTSGNIGWLTLDLACGAPGDGETTQCGATPTNGLTDGDGENYGNGKTIQTTISGSTTIALNSVSGIQVGDLLELGTASRPAAYVTAVCAAVGPGCAAANTITVSASVSVSATEAISFMHQGAITVSLFDDSASNIPGSSTTTNDQPAGSALSSFTVYDAQLYLTNSATDSGGVPFRFNSPFGSTQLQPNTAYWIELSDDTADPTPTLAEWEFVETNKGINVSDNYWSALIYDGSCTADGASNPCGWLDGGPLPFAVSGGEPVSFGMQVEYVPGPASLPLLVVGSIGLFAIRRHRRPKTHGAAQA